MRPDGLIARVPADALGVVLAFVPRRERAALRLACRAACAAGTPHRVRVYAYATFAPWLEVRRRTACADRAAAAGRQPWRASVRLVTVHPAGACARAAFTEPTERALAWLARWIAAAFPRAETVVLPAAWHPRARAYMPGASLVLQDSEHALPDRPHWHAHLGDDTDANRRLARSTVAGGVLLLPDRAVASRPPDERAAWMRKQTAGATGARVVLTSVLWPPTPGCRDVVLDWHEGADAPHPARCDAVALEVRCREPRCRGPDGVAAALRAVAWPRLRRVVAVGAHAGAAAAWAAALPRVEALGVVQVRPSDAALGALAAALRGRTAPLRVHFVGPDGPLLRLLLASPSVHVWAYEQTSSEPFSEGLVAALDRHGHLRSVWLFPAEQGRGRAMHPAVHDGRLWRNSPHLRAFGAGRPVPWAPGR